MGWIFWGAMLLPFIVAVLFFSIAFLQEQTRYASEYFTPEYTNRYQTPDRLLADLERALQTGDAPLLAALQGTRAGPGEVAPRPQIRFLLASSQNGPYSDYLFFDDGNNGKYMQHLKSYRGRYIVVPEGIYYYVDSGTWRAVLAPPAGIWWSVLILVGAGVWVFQIFKNKETEL